MKKPYITEQEVLDVLTRYSGANSIFVQFVSWQGNEIDRLQKLATEVFTMAVGYKTQVDKLGEDLKKLKESK